MAGRARKWILMVFMYSVCCSITAWTFHSGEKVATVLVAWWFMANFLQQWIFSIRLYLTLVIFGGLPKADFRLLLRGAKMINQVSEISLSASISNIWNGHANVRLDFTDSVLPQKTHSFITHGLVCLRIPVLHLLHIPFYPKYTQEFVDTLPRPNSDRPGEGWHKDLSNLFRTPSIFTHVKPDFHSVPFLTMLRLWYCFLFLTESLCKLC